MYKANSDNILLELNLKTMFNANNVSKQQFMVWFKAVVFKPVLQAPLPCIFCTSPLSDTPNSGLAVSSNELMSWIGCVW